ncbi:glycerophosphodiester phosphodiesterase [Nocardioides sp. KIGAM211]|uniref:Glycerophosphodiester phosphodiesterase n=1 Tax=Nocardioides luti TaxID=2761101 RepID=A0A7X0VAA3_9ACTN|nr:glycerophosphodiester phosphodiesterase [Nocardioides luti]
MRRVRERVQVSAHRAGAGDDVALENTRAAFVAALELEVDFVEFDVQRCGDGTLVIRHDPSFLHGDSEVRLADLTSAEAHALLPDLLTYDDVLEMLAGRRAAHIDLKASVARDPRHAVAATASAVERLGADGFVVTTGSDQAVRAIRDWSDEQGLDLLVGLSLGGNVRGRSVREQVRIRLSELLPHRRLQRSRASVVVAHHSLARLGVARFARRRGLPLLVWTVDTPRSLAHWLRPGGAWLVTSNHPALALAVRAARERRHLKH